MTFPRVARPGRAAGAASAQCRRRSLLIRAWSLGVLGGSVLVAGCGLDSELPPNPVAIVAITVSSRVEFPGGETEERRRLVDGEASDPEWNQIPYFHIAMGPENGNQGGSFVASVKAARDSTRLYLLVQWPDDAPNRLGPRLRWDPATSLAPTGCDSLLVRCSWTLIEDDEDRLAIMWDMGSAGDASGTFRDNGCQVACHGNMHPLTGKVDIWQWRAARTNPIQFPFFGGGRRVGFADDGYADGGGRVDDPGSSFFRSNIQMVNCGSGRQGPRPLEIPDVLDVDGRPTNEDNDNMLPCDYINDATAFSFNFCERINPCRQFEQEEVVDWVEGDDVSATLLSRPANEAARRSRHDVEARGRWTDVTEGGTPKGVWTLELSRALRVAHSEDIDFDVNRIEPYTMAIAIMNNNGRIHAGSPPIQVLFNPNP